MSTETKLPAEMADLKALIKECLTENNEEVKKNGHPNEELFRHIADSHEVAKRQGYEPGIRLARMARATALAGGDSSKALEIISKVYGDPTTAREIEKAMEAGTPAAGGLLVPEQYSNEIVPLSRNYTVLMEAMPRMIPNPTGTLHMSRHTGSATSYWGREGQKIKASKPTVGRLTLREKTLRGIVGLSNRLLALSNVDVDRFALEDLVAGQAVMIDYAGINGAGGEDEPLGILKTPGINSVTIGALLTATNTTKFLQKHMNSKGTLFRPHWFFNVDVWFQLVNLQFDTNGPFVYRDEINAGKFWGIPFGMTQQIPNSSATHKPTSMILCDMMEFLVAHVRTAEIAISKEAAYYDESGNIQAAFGNDETAIRLVQSLDMGPRRLESFTVSTDVWTE